MTTAFVALGSNLAGVLESPQAQLNAALASLDNLAFSRVRRVSSFYSTPAWGDENQPSYVNAVAEMHTDLAADALLSALQVIENAADDPPIEQPEAFLKALLKALGSSTEREATT